MSTTLARPKPRKKRGLPHTPNYLTILPPGRIIEEKIFEMGIDVAELARRMEVPIETAEKLIRYEIPLTEDLAQRLEKATWMPAHVMLRFEAGYRRDLILAREHPEIPAYLGDEIINQPKRKKKAAS